MKLLVTGLKPNELASFESSILFELESMIDEAIPYLVSTARDSQGSNAEFDQIKIGFSYRQPDSPKLDMGEFVRRAMMENLFGRLLASAFNDGIRIEKLIVVVEHDTRDIQFANKYTFSHGASINDIPCVDVKTEPIFVGDEVGDNECNEYFKSYSTDIRPLNDDNQHISLFALMCKRPKE